MHGLKYDPRRCSPHQQQVTSFTAWIPIYTNEGRQGREAAAQLQLGAWVTSPQWQEGWRQLTFRGATRYRDVAGQTFWVNTRDLAWIEERPMPWGAQEVHDDVAGLAHQLEGALLNGH
jgi:hypothetical protein